MNPLFRLNSNLIRRRRQPGWPLILPSASGPRGPGLSMLGGSIVAEGDSLTYGTGATPGVTDYPTQCVALLGPAYTLTLNAGVAGQEVTHMASDAATQIDPLYSAANANNLLLFWGGSNDCGTAASAATVWGRVQSYVQARQAVGWTVVVLTILPRSDICDYPELATKRDAINTYLRDNEASEGYYLADIAADGRIGDCGDEDNLTYFANDGGIHLNATGYSVVAEIVAARVRRLFALP